MDSQCFIQAFFDVCRGLKPDKSFDFPAITKEDQCWNALYHIICCQGFLIINIDFKYCGAALILFDHVRDNGFHGFTGPAPGCTEVNQNDLVFQAELKLFHIHFSCAPPLNVR